MLEIKLFGSGQLSYSGRQLAGFPHQLPYILLCYLLLNRHYPQNRERLAAVFWGDYPMQTSRKCLRNVLWRLRCSFQALDCDINDYLYLSDDTVTFTPNGQYWLDVEAFECLTAPCTNVDGPKLSVLQVSQLESAADLYSGDLLESIYEDWCLYDRERLRLQHLNNLYKLMVYHGANHNYEQGIDYGKRLLTLDNTREKVHRQLMWLYWLIGDRNTALSQYKLCCQILREALNIGPMQETHQLYEQMLHDHFDPENWQANMRTSAELEKKPGMDNHPLINRILSELHRLQGMIDETRARSHLLEQLIDEALNK